MDGRYLPPHPSPLPGERDPRWPIWGGKEVARQTASSPWPCPPQEESEFHSLVPTLPPRQFIDLRND
jgi:hypothetical protein